MKKKSIVNQILAEVGGWSNPLPKNILGALGFLGDIGACVQDIAGKKETDAKKIVVQKAIFAYFGDISAQCTDYYGKYAPDHYYDDGIPPTTIGKQIERKSCSAEADKTKPPIMKMVPRAGVMNAGDEVDKALNLTSDKTLPKIGWPWQTVPKKLVEACPNEPWAGHFSGSLYELVLMLELFNRADPKKAETYTADQKKLMIGWASGFLIATGMHSAVELNYVVKNYLGTKVEKTELIPKTANSGAVCSDATSNISGVINWTHDLK